MSDLLPTPSELVGIGEAAFLSKLPLADTNTGSDIDTALSVMSSLEARNARHIAYRASARSRSSATGTDLDVLASDLYYTARLAGEVATGTLHLSRSGTGATSIPKGSRFSVPQSGGQASIVFIASSTVSVAGGATTKNVAIEATAEGTDGNVDLALITEITDPLPDDTWVIVPPSASTEATAGGSNEETDDELRQRLSQGAPDDTRVRGTVRAVLVGILAVPGVAYATVLEPLDGTLKAFVGDASYNLSAPLKAAVLTAVDAWRCGGVPVDVYPYAPSTISIELTIYMNQLAANYDTATIIANATTNVINYFKAARGDEYILEAIASAAKQGIADVQGVEVTSPATDQPRHAATYYASQTSIPRYSTDAGHISITVADPQSA